jgi:hypothetical protein
MICRPAFHNGVASALGCESYFNGEVTNRDLTRSWIVFNKPERKASPDVVAAHAGVLLAWGLNGDLASLTLADLYEHVHAPNELTSIAVMLGLGCASAGSCDADARKTLTLHMPSLFPPVFRVRVLFWGVLCVFWTQVRVACRLWRCSIARRNQPSRPILSLNR